MEKIRENPTQKPVNGKLQRAIMWTQIADILRRCEKWIDASPILRDEIDSITNLDLILSPISNYHERKVFISEMNA